MDHPFIAEIGPATGEWAADISLLAEIDIADESVAGLYLVTEGRGGTKRIELTRRSTDPFLAMCWEAGSAALVKEREAIEDKLRAARAGIAKRGLVIIGGEYDRYRA